MTRSCGPIFLYTVGAVILAWGCSTTRTGNPASAAPALAVHAIALPGASTGPIFMDYMAYDSARHQIWVPAGNTGSVDVVDAATGRVTRVEGFPTAEVERRGTKRTVGPSSATIGAGVVYIGNRADSTVCEVLPDVMRIGACLKLDSMPDGLAYVASTREVWVTTPRAGSIAVLDASTPGALTLKAKIALEGEPEGYAVDDARGLFYTNLEDKDRTLAIDIQSRQVAKTWMPACGEDGPKGLALDHSLNFLMVACTDHVLLLDAGHDGKTLSKIDVGAGVDNIDYVEPRHELYAAAGRAAKLTIAHIDAQGKLAPFATVPTASGARNAVATENGTAYLTDSPEGKVLVVTPAASR